MDFSELGIGPGRPTLVSEVLAWRSESAPKFVHPGSSVRIVGRVSIHHVDMDVCEVEDAWTGNQSAARPSRMRVITKMLGQFVVPHDSVVQFIGELEVVEGEGSLQLAARIATPIAYLDGALYVQALYAQREFAAHCAAGAKAAER